MRRSTNLRRNILFVFTLMCLAGQGYAQTLSRKDADEIRVLAREKVKGLNDLLNAIANEDLSNYERRYLMMNSYMPSNDQIFVNDGVIVEDDTDPKNKVSAPGLDTPIEKYLSNFDLFYTKTEINTIEFTNIVVGDVKVDKYPFVKVFYTQHFKGKSNRDNTPFTSISRVAELRADKSGNDWVVFLTRIAFNSAENAKAVPVTPKPSEKYDSLQRKKEPIAAQPTDKKPVATPEETRQTERVSQQISQVNQAQIAQARKWGAIKLGAGVAALAFGAVTYSMLNKDYKDYKNRIENSEGFTSYAKPGVYISIGAAAVGIGLSVSSIFDFKTAKGR
ncbi:hypothetical protein [Dyadobacter sp. CY323]|uniref:hypothetical protein n=1 Tax=Dyadobacter sp. CY323 TaxID=2907302 RepID=UPI001F1D836F|nr:hypothetical protein [Dyadobacter sp. CY323]MCE6988892.1 hypothetical protein [Dyadobacter sp. CY323]